ncbi:MAG TPA: PTS sugar transporter subunit IIC [bacterium]|jgi:mannose/fructose/N-acetylgalactosamine-specific phosphotransferase system component IIC|nr:PTS sugar transporter subunit IIC [bacterium]
MLPLGTLFLLSAVAGLLGLDSTGAFQIMVSRPLVVGGVFGCLLGHPGAGLAAGSLVEMLYMAGLPVGSLVPPDGVAAAALASAVAVSLAHASEVRGAPYAAEALGLIASVPAGFLGARAEVVQRTLTNRLSRSADADLDAGRMPKVGGLLALALGLAWLRGFLVSAFCLDLGLPALAVLLDHLPAAGIHALHWCFWLFWLLGMAVATNHFWERRGLKYAAIAALLMALVGARAAQGQFGVLAAAIGLAMVSGWWRWTRARRGEMA